jgi:hypothetical protein
MNNPFEKWTQKDWLYVGGAIASIAGLIWFATKQANTIVAAPSGTVTDTPNLQSPAPSPANYINYNSYNVPDIIPTQGGADVSPDKSGSGCCGGCGDKAGNSYCADPSPLSTGNTFTDTAALLQYYQNTNPAYIDLQKYQLEKYNELAAINNQQYAALFAQGETYAKGAQTFGVQGVV